MCHAASVDTLVIAFIIVQAIALGIAIALAIVRGRTLGRVRELLAPTGDDPTVPIDPEGVDVEQGVRVLLDRTKTAEWTATQVERDRAALLDIIGVGIVRLDDDLRVDAANIAAHQFLRRAPGSLVGRSAIEAFIDPTIEAVAETARESGQAGGELTLRSDDGPTLVVRARRSPSRGIWLVMEDVSELRRLQRIRAEFIDNLSHELRTPLTTVSLLAETLVREADGAGEAIPPRMRDRIAKIEVETDHLVQMVEELLDLSRIESGGPLVMLDEVDLGRLAVASVERLRLFAERQGVELRTDVPDVVPPVRGAEDRLGQVLVNLLHNAVKFSPDGGEVVVRVAPTDEEVVVSVEDHGIGIPQGRPGPDLRALLQGRQGPPAGRRDGARPGDRAARRRGPRRADPGRVGGGPRVDVLVRAADPRPGGGLSGMDRLHVATLNILNLADRWDERLPLLLADFAALQPDVMGLQEVVYVLQQDRVIGAAGAGEYRAIRGWAGRPEYGNSMLVRTDLEPTDRGPARPRPPAGGPPGPARAAERGEPRVRRHPPPPRGPGGPPSATARPRPSSPGSTGRRPPMPRSSSATSTPTRASRPTPG